ncbi:serine/threonine protein phosphatase PrpC [Flavobacterium sp. 28A]|uniref:PP2C family serine/threonine-protein phosphatase n=1 Tax=Flavobacterium sp. 28A TaxID=2735895 RepID=UPI00157009F0|nr:PP2C family serine/threonine-protein phosphatase [Flavobacterium sp. 28A]NRT16985.1 serine/threonine protein phosphatase PrpC [Flavobacterium sp. 28A]
MEEIEKYIKAFLSQNKIDITANKAALFKSFIENEENINSVKIIQENQRKIMVNWKLKTRIDDIISQSISLPNGTVNKNYETKIDFDKLGWSDFISFEIQGLEQIGLEFNPEDKILFGNPKISGDLKIQILFRVEGEDDNITPNVKTITLIINPDPKSLWKNIESDQDDPFWKEDNVSTSSDFLDKKIVIASKRGRSHANVGSFRDDHFTYKNINDSGWSVVAVSDGAGSASLSREGSKISCELIVSYFEEHFTPENLKEFDETLFNHHNKTGEDTSKKISRFVYENLSKAAWFVNKELEKTATKLERPLKDFHATLIFTLVKKYDFGYAILSFGVGDCPIGLINKDMTEIKLMNWLDVGEFGGGTRFITMPEIFQSEQFQTRFGFKLVDDFSYLMLMTDGIYDPKFVVEANLEKIEKWNEFLVDLQGENQEGLKVDFNYENAEIADQLSNWMDFWNPGNHDDRTLAIIY